MISLPWIVLFNVFASSHGDCLLEHDDALLLQTTAVTKAITKKTGSGKALHIHRFRVDVQGHSVSLLQGHLDVESKNPAVFSVCAVDAAGTVEEFHDEGGSQVDTCGEMEITDDTGDPVDHVLGCTPSSVNQGACFIFTEAPNFAIDDDNTNLYGTEAQDGTDVSNVVLVEIPDMDESKVSAAQEEVAKKLQDHPGAPVIFIGSGAKLMRHSQFRIFLFMGRLYANTRRRRWYGTRGTYIAGIQQVQLETGL